MHPEPIKEYSPEVKKEDSSQKLRLEASDDSPSSPDNKDSPPPVEPITKLESEPVPPKEEEPPVETPVKKSILDVEESEQPPKPLHLMTSAEKTMWDLELKYKEMKRQMEM